MQVKTIELNIGAPEPFSVFHITDDHICLADERDNERKRELAYDRGMGFSGGRPERQLEIAREMTDFVKKEGLPLIHTGDLIDFVSYANLDFAREYFKGIDVIFSAGNHEFSQYVGEAWEDEDYKKQSFAAVAAAMPDGMEFGVRMIHGVKFITIDDGYYYVLPSQLEMLKKELSDGISAVLVLHNPVYSADIHSQVMLGKSRSDPPYLTGCPEELLTELSDHRLRQQKPDETTLEFVKLCNSAGNLKAVLAGHLHKEYISRLDSGIPQIAAEGAFSGTVYKYNFI